MQESASLVEAAHTQNDRVLPEGRGREGYLVSGMYKGHLLPSHADGGRGQPTHLRVLMIDFPGAGLLQQDYEEPVGKNKSGSIALTAMGA